MLWSPNAVWKHCLIDLCALHSCHGANMLWTDMRIYFGKPHVDNNSTTWGSATVDWNLRPIVKWWDMTWKCVDLDFQWVDQIQCHNLTFSHKLSEFKCHPKNSNFRLDKKIRHGFKFSMQWFKFNDTKYIFWWSTFQPIINNHVELLGKCCHLGVCVGSTDRQPRKRIQYGVS